LRRLCLVALAISIVLPALAQYSADKPLGASAQSAPAYLKNAGLDQRLGTQIPLNLHFKDSTGADAPLGRYFGRKPVALALVYYKCAMLCPQVLHGLADGLKQTTRWRRRDTRRRAITT
jgi:protein SCO1/2